MPDGRAGEVISVVARRRRWTLDQKLALVEEVSRPGASVASVADRHGMSRSLLFDWRRQAREGTMPGVIRADAGATLVPVQIVADVSPEPAAPNTSVARGRVARSCKTATTVEVVLPNGRMLRVSDAISPDVLGRLAAALDARC